MSRVKHLASVLTEAVAKCASGGRVGLQISGGLDSAIIQAIGKFQDLVCATWDDCDNITMAQAAAQGVDVRRVTFSREEMLEVLPEVARLTNGRGTWSQVCQWFLDRELASMGCDIVLNGEGADERFGGYSRYKVLYWIQRMMDDPKLAAYRPTIEHLLGKPRDIVASMLSRTTSPAMADRMADKANWDRGLVGAMASAEEHCGLVELIGYEGRIAASHGLTHRWPFMDESVGVFARGMAPSEMVNNHSCKALLRRTARELGVPEEIIQEQTKKGLFIPQSWRPPGEPLWSRKWFEDLMSEAA